MSRIPVKLLMITYLFAAFANAELAAMANQQVLEDLSKMYRSSMAYIFKQQALINGDHSDKNQLFGYPFIENVKQAHQAKFSQPFPAIDHPLKQKLIEAMIEVMEDNRTLIYDKELNFKGFIPAIFALQLSNKLSQKGLGVKIKFTSHADMIRNQFNQPDDWETAAMAKLAANKKNYLYDENASYQGKAAYRHFTPITIQPFCLTCHGSPGHNPLNENIAKEQWSSFDVTGFKMEGWRLGDFGGGISVVVYEL